MKVETMRRASVNGTELEYQVLGSGEPVVLVHGAILADGFYPLLAEPAFRDRLEEYREMAADCLALLRHLEVERAHVVGHSYGGTIALQVALDGGPERVHSLALFELLLPRNARDLALADADTFFCVEVAALLA